VLDHQLAQGLDPLLGRPVQARAHGPVGDRAADVQEAGRARVASRRDRRVVDPLVQLADRAQVEAPGDAEPARAIRGTGGPRSPAALTAASEGGRARDARPLRIASEAEPHKRWRRTEPFFTRDAVVVDAPVPTGCDTAMVEITRPKLDAAARIVVVPLTKLRRIA
jgi:hypothetical protein